MPIFFIQSRYTVPHTDIITPLAKYYDILGREDLPPKLSFSEGIRYILPEMEGCMVIFNPSDQKDEELLDAIMIGIENAELRNKFFLLLQWGDFPLPFHWDKYKPNVKVVRIDDNSNDFDRVQEINSALKEISRNLKQQEQIQAQPTSSDRPQGNWLIKINDTSWPISEFKIGQTYTFSANHHQNSVQADYPNFKRLKPGEHVYALAIEHLNQIVALFKLSEALHQEGEDEIVKLEVVELMEPPVPLSALQSLPFFPELNYQFNEKLYPLDEKGISLIRQSIIHTNFTDEALSLIRQQASITALTPDTPLGDLPDDLDIMADVRAIAGVIAYREVKPPLSIGLFGNWGSGKSFFMEKMQQEIERLAQTGDRYCKEVVAIKFNSWHYSDANLWASLSTRIFEELDRYGKRKNPSQLENLYANLHSTKEQEKLTESLVNQAETALKEVEQKFADNEQRLHEKTRHLAGLSSFKITTSVLNNPQVQSDISELKKEVDFVPWNSVDQIIQKSETLFTFSGNLSAVLQQAYSFRKGKLWMALATMALVAIAVYLLLPVYIPFLRLKFGFVKDIVFAILGICSQLLLFIKPASKVISKVSERLSSLSQTIELLQEQEQRDQATEISKLKAEVATAEAVRQGLLNQQQKLQEQQSALNVELGDIRQGKKVQSFIETRLVDKRYADQLGMISWIRKDFEMLDYLLKQQHEVVHGEQAVKGNSRVDTFQIDRIVLYIDDLDRCEANTVVKVLEAIHLLLAFPLFVVIVGVDPNWMENALASRFDDMIGTNRTDNESRHNMISPSAYLEKIFQIPFRLRKVNSAGFNKLIYSQLHSSVGKSVAASPKPVPSLIAVPEETEISLKNGNSASLQEHIQGSYTSTSGNLKATSVSTSQQASQDLMLEIPADEITCIQGLYGILPNSPRTIKRFINIYRILRSHTYLQFDQDNPKEYYQAVMLLLALLTGKGNQAMAFFDSMHAANDDIPLIAFIQQHEITTKFPQITEQLALHLKQGNKLENFGALKLEVFKQNMDLVSRFSFK